MIASQLDMKKKIVRKIITENLGMWKVWTSLLNDEQKKCRCVRISSSIFKPNQICFVELPGGDEIWTFEYDLENKM